MTVCFKFIFILLMLVLLAACSSAEDQINAAFPPDKNAEIMKAAYIETAKKNNLETDSFEATYKARLKQRMVECSQGYEPGWLDTKDSIIQEVGNAECFAAVDKKLVKWLSLSRVALSLSMPALRPIPTKASETLVAKEPVLKASFAEAAGVAALMSMNHFEIFDLGNARTIYQGPIEKYLYASLSPNGRIMATGFAEEALFWDVEMGIVLAKLNGLRSGRVSWVSDKGVLFVREAGNEIIFLDFVSGLESKIPVSTSNLLTVAKTSASSNVYALICSDSIAFFELTQSSQGVAAKLTREIMMHFDAWTYEPQIEHGMFYYTANSSVSQVNLVTQSKASMPFNSVRVTRVLPMKEPDQALVNIKITNGYGYGDIYVYSFTQRSLAKLDRRQLPSDRLSFISSLGKYAVFDGMKIVLIDQLPTEPAIALNTMIDKLAWDRQIALAEALDSQNASSTSYVSGVASEYNYIAPQRKSVPSQSPEAGLAEAVRAGAIRPGGVADINVWKSAFQKKYGKALGHDFDERIKSMPVYVIKGEFTMPPGLVGSHAAIFVLFDSMLYPQGRPEDSLILEIGLGECLGPRCKAYGLR